MHGRTPRQSRPIPCPGAPAAGRLPQPLRWHGGKYYLARRIVALMPRHRHYVEPFFGGGAVLLARDPSDPALWLAPHRGVSEVVNDRDGRLTNFWRVLQEPAAFARFRRRVAALPVSRAEWDRARHHVDGTDAVADAVAFFVACRQSRSGLLRTFAPLARGRTRRAMSENASAWLSAVGGLAAVHARLRGVVIENVDALRLIRREDGPGTLFYCDPPYLPATRAVPSAYAAEMTETGHRALLEAVRHCRGRVMLSGYPSGLYDAALAGWTRHAFDVPNHAAGGRRKRRMTEVVWCNF